MCVVSMISESYRDRWSDRFPVWFPDGLPQVPDSGKAPVGIEDIFKEKPQVTREEFDDLRRQVEEMKDLLKRAKKYDEDNGEPDCEMDRKVALIKSIAEVVGVDLEDIFGK